MSHSPAASFIAPWAKRRGRQEMLKESFHVLRRKGGGRLRRGSETSARQHHGHGGGGHRSNCNVIVPIENSSPHGTAGEAVKHDTVLEISGRGAILVIYMRMAVRAGEESRCWRRITCFFLGPVQCIKSILGVLGKETGTKREQCAGITPVHIRLRGVQGMCLQGSKGERGTIPLGSILEVSNIVPDRKCTIDNTIKRAGCH